MFTGIVTAVGTVRGVEPLAAGRRFAVEVEPGFLDGAHAGDSVAIDGVCLTIVALTPTALTVEAIGTTLSRTTLAEFEPGRPVNLEHALALGERLGGHLVQGHVDGVGRVEAVAERGEHVLIDVALPDDVAEVTVLHGSIAIDGVSLTVNALPAAGRAQVAVIPYTWEHTNLSRLRAGSAVNLEGDMLGRFVVHYLKSRDATGGQGAEHAV
jgi:riboflavin synthase alpha subunit